MCTKELFFLATVVPFFSILYEKEEVLSNFTAEQLIRSRSPLFSVLLLSAIIGLVKAAKNNKMKNIIKLNVRYPGRLLNVLLGSI